MQESVRAWRRRWKRRIRSRKWSYRRFPALRNLLVSVAIVLFFDFGLFGLLIVVANYNLLDARTAVSVVLPEVGIAVVLYYLLGQGHRERLSEIADTMEVWAKVSHLKIYGFEEWGKTFYFVENPSTKQAYQASDFVQKVIDEGILKPIVCKDEKEMKRILRKNGTTLNERQPSLDELFNRP